MQFEKNRVIVDPPKKPKKMTATRFASVLGLNRWKTPFAVWCEMTRTYEEPFEDSIYTIAGKVIEPKVCDYLRSHYFMDIKSPTDVYGSNYFKKTWGDFFPDVEAFGGMWDFLGDDYVVEVKTTKRVEDWQGPDGKVEPPIYYKLQAALYAYLLGFDKVVMTCSFLQPQDYEQPEAFEPAADNTVIFEFSLSESFPNFEEDYIKPALDFWRSHVLTGVSPEYDEKKDADILKELRKHIVTGDKDLKKLVKEADRLKASIDKAEARIDEKKKRLKEIDGLVKKELTKQFRAGDTRVVLEGTNYTWTVRKDTTNTFDKKKFEHDHQELYKDYLKTTNKYVLTKKEIEEETEDENINVEDF